MNSFAFDSPIFIAGHNGMVGSSLKRKLEKKGFNNLIIKDRSDLDLRDQLKVREFFELHKPAYVLIAAAKVGGIKANSDSPANFLYENLIMECNLIHEAFVSGVKNLLFLGSSCIYPKFSQQPIKEDSLLTAPLETTNEAYALAKISGIKLCDYYSQQYGVDYRSLMPTNLYGPGDNFNLEESHVIPALISKFHEAKKLNKDKVEVWGSGNVLREFLHVDDLADACYFVMNTSKNKFQLITDKIDARHLNVGTGKDLTINELSHLIKEIVGFNGEIYFNTSMPDGTPRKLLDVSLINRLGWTSSIDLKKGLMELYNWYENNQTKIRN